ncbi:hypothetical protein NKH18_45830 [Streptomyces sp. M10(2022)]
MWRDPGRPNPEGTVSCCTPPVPNETTRRCSPTRSRRSPHERRYAGDRRRDHTVARLVAEPQDAGVDAAVAAARRVIEALLGSGNQTDTDMGAAAAQLHAVADRIEAQAPIARPGWPGCGRARV